MNILITGSTGFLGKEVKLALKKYKHKLFFIGKKKTKEKNYFYCRLENLKKVKFITNLIEPDIIINLAAVINFQKKTKNMYEVNALVPKFFAEYCKKKKKIFYSGFGHNSEWNSSSV